MPKKKSKKTQRVVAPKLNLAALQKKKEERAEEKAKGGLSFWTPKPGDNHIRLLPPWTDEGPNAGVFALEVWQHWPVEGVTNYEKSVRCPEKMGEGECYICERVRELYATKDPADAEDAAELRAKRQYLSNIIDLDDAENEDGSPKVQVWGYGVQMYDRILAMILDPDWGDVTDLYEGRDLTVVRDGKGRNTKYDLRGSPKQSELEDIEKILEGMKDLEKLPGSEIYDMDQLEALYTTGKLPGEASKQLAAPKDEDSDEASEQSEDSEDSEADSIDEAQASEDEGSEDGSEDEGSEDSEGSEDEESEEEESEEESEDEPTPEPEPKKKSKKSKSKGKDAAEIAAQLDAAVNDSKKKKSKKKK